MQYLQKLSIALCLCLCAFSASAQHHKTLSFTAIPDADSTRLQQRFSKIAHYLSTELGVEVKYVPVKSYAAAITAFRNDQVQLAWFGGLSGVQARKLVVGSKAIAQGYEDQFFETYFIANASTGLSEIAASKELPTGMRGKSFTFGSKGSTSGRLMPEYHLRSVFKQAPREVFSKVGFSGNHTKTIELVQAGAYDLGAVNFKVWQKELAAGNIDTSKVQVIWKTPTYPDYQWSIRGDADQEFGKGFSAKVTAALLNMQDKELLAAFPRSSFVKSTNDFYQPIEDTAKSIGLID